MYWKRIVVPAFILSVLVFGAASATAQTGIQIDFGNPNLDVQDTSIPVFLNSFYLFALVIGGVLAMGAIVFGGVMYITEGAIPQKKTEGKTIILGALWGLALLLGAYVILRTVNPEIVTLDVVDLDQAKLEVCADNKDLPICTENPPQNERDEEGKCVCRKKSLIAQCPQGVEIPPENPNPPEYLWTKESGLIENDSQTLEWGEIPDISTGDGCPQFVKILPGTTPYFITSVDDDTFVMDLSKQPKDLGNENITFPLPEGYSYLGELTPRYITENPNRALCVLNGVRVSGNGVSYTHRISDSILSSTGKCRYGNFSTSTNEVELEVKEGGEGYNMDCKVGTAACSPQSIGGCARWSSEVDTMSKICVVESQENPIAVSESDFCKNEASLPKADRHPFSLGLFQINVVAHKEKIRTLLGNDAATLCGSLFTGETTLVDKKNPKLGYNCDFVGTNANWLTCRALISKVNTNISLACKIYEEQGKNAWKTTVKKCDL